MKTVKIIIERSADMFSSYAENVEGIYGSGETVKEAKISALHAIVLLKKYNDKDKIPKILLGDYEVVYHYDMESLLQYYKGILSNPAVEKLTGINQKLIHQYSTGLKKPGPIQRKRIEEGLHKLGKELLSIEL